MIKTRYKLYPCEWSVEDASVIMPQKLLRKEQTVQHDILYIKNIIEQTHEDLAIIQNIITDFERTGRPFSAEDVVRHYHSFAEKGIAWYARGLIDKLRSAHVPIAEKYRVTLHKFLKFTEGRDFAFNKITPMLMVEFESWMKGQVSRNTSSFYMRNLHAIYNRAINDGIVVEASNPFHSVYTGVDQTQKRAISLEDIKRIKNYDLSDNKKMAFARDLFMFSFYTRGMSFIDIAYLKKSNVKERYLFYRHSKTSQTIIVKWMPEMDNIVKQYSPYCRCNYLLPILSVTDYTLSRKQYDYAGHKLNRTLRQLGNLIGLTTPLTMYVARHSWATAAQTNNIPLSIISQSLGHNSENTTRIYLASINTSEVDNANEKILQSLL